MGLSNKRFAMPRSSEEELRGMARAIVRGQAWVACTPEEVDLSGMMLLMGLAAASWCTPKYLRQVGTLVGYLKDAMPQGVNGVPMFHTARFIHRHDIQTLFRWIRHYEEVLAA